MTGSDLYLSKDSIWNLGLRTRQDYRCLAPYSHKDPQKWATYDIKAFRAAYDKKTMGKVKTKKYDGHFNNFINPTVLHAFIKNPKKEWQKSFGLPNAKPLPWAGDNREATDSTKCHIKCANLVSLP